MAGLGELLVRESMISVEQLQEAQSETRRSGVRLGASLVKLGMLEEGKLLEFLSRQYHVPSIN
ncbi:MAG: type II secretion system protein GspE, partial [Deltaproteobacteria bacterium]|nr:type II secretion system protein GspE [Deltaproteobacteria bacterium]